MTRLLVALALLASCDAPPLPPTADGAEAGDLPTCGFRFSEAVTFQACPGAPLVEDLRPGLCRERAEVPYEGPPCVLRSEFSDKAFGVCVAACGPDGGP